MKISNTTSGMHLYLTDEEKSHFPTGRLLIRMTSGAILLYNDPSGVRINRADSVPGHPWRADQKVKGAPRLFGSQAVSYSVGSSGSLLLSHPDTTILPRKFTNRRKQTGPTIGLRDAIDAVNKHKRSLGNDLVLEVGEDGRLRATMQYGA